LFQEQQKRSSIDFKRLLKDTLGGEDELYKLRKGLKYNEEEEEEDTSISDCAFEAEL
jgi:hypothetical protein